MFYLANIFVGFSESNVILLGDKKQKDNKGLRDTLVVPEDDGCVEFAEEVSIKF